MVTRYDIDKKFNSALEEIEEYQKTKGKIDAYLSIFQEMLMFEHRQDINNFKSRWDELKKLVEERAVYLDKNLKEVTDADSSTR